MKTVFILIPFTAVLAFSQSLTGPVPATHGPSRAVPATARPIEVAPPILGYTTDTVNTLRSVVGPTANANWGDSLVVPDATGAVFLPPRQEYALLTSEAGLSIARLSRREIHAPTLIPGAMEQPKSITFSPTGEAAALLSATQTSLQILTYSAGELHVIRTLPFAVSDDLQRLAVSDDGELVTAVFANQPPIYSWQGGSWQTLTTNYSADAWTFIPHTHDLLLSDQTQKTIVLVKDVQKPQLG